MIGRVISHYQIVQKLGEGGMGAVFRAEDTTLKRTVALKFLPVDVTRDLASKERFLVEAQAASALEHTNICAVHDVSETEDGQMFIVMSYCEGESLAEKIQGGPLELARAINITMQVAEGLAAAHKRGIVHRDIKPGNIILSGDGVVKIIDFGLARLAGISKLTQTGMMLGTISYMSPEQARGERIDHRTDIWSLGVVLYEMLIGRPPFMGKYAPAMIYSILNEDPQPVTNLRTTIPHALDVIVSKVLAKDLSERYGSMAELSADLRVFSTTAPKQVPAVPIPLLQRVPDERSIQSVVVLPLLNLSKDPEEEYFADGMTEAVTACLAKVRALKVISRTSAMRYKGTSMSLPEIAEELKVEAVLEGSVMRSGKRVRITVQLIHAGTDAHLWAETYERDLEDVLILQSELAKAIAREIKVGLSQQEERRFAGARSINPEAYDAYLAGCFHFHKLNPEQFDKALEYYQLALKKEPNCPLAHVGIANVWFARSYWGIMSPRDSMPKAKKAILEALDLDDSLEEAHDVFGRIRFYNDWNWDGAEIEFRKAIQLNPSYALAHLFYSSFLRSMGRDEAAMLEVRQGLELDPINHFTRGYFVGQLLHMRRFDEAIRQLRKILKSEPHFPMAHRYLWVAYHQERMYDDAIEAAMEYFSSLGKEEITEVMRRGYAAVGYEGGMKLVAEMLEEQSKRSYVPPVWVARLHAHGANTRRALEWLEKAYQERDPVLVNLRASSDWENLRTDPQFLDLQKRMNFPEPNATPSPAMY